MKQGQEGRRERERGGKGRDRGVIQSTCPHTYHNTDFDSGFIPMIFGSIKLLQHKHNHSPLAPTNQKRVTYLVVVTFLLFTE